MSDFDPADLLEIADLLHIRRARRLTILIVGVAVLVVGAITTALFLVKTITINITPARAAENSEIVSEKGFSLTLGRNVHFFSAVEVEANAEGFYSKTIALDRSTESPISLELLPKPGLISIEMDFLLDGSRSEYALSANDAQLFEPVPESIELSTGRYELRLRGPQEYDSTQFIEVVGFGTKQVVSFKPMPRGSFSVTVIPEAAKIKLNGKVVGSGEVQMTVVAKNHVLEFELDGYLSKRLPFAVDANSRLDLGTVDLASAPGTVKFASDPTTASIFIDGQFVGSTPKQLELDKSSINVELRKPNFHNVSETVQVVPGNTISLEYVLEAIRFDVEVSANPQATLIVNNKSRGLTPRTVNVTAGDTLVVSKEGYASQSVTIESEPKQRRQLDFELVDMAQHLYNKAPEYATVQDSIQLKKFPAAKFHLLVPRYLMEDDLERTRDFEITRPFYVGVFEITRKEFAKFDSSMKVETSEEDLPVTDISWLEAIKFCNWLSQAEGLEPAYAIGSGASVSIDLGSNGYRLPTEAEWELIAYYDFTEEKAVGPFVWGEGTKPPSRIGNLAGYETRSALQEYIHDYGDNHKVLAPVGSYRRNVNGIHDIAGNAAEWVFDYFRGPYDGWDSSLTDPMGPSRGIDRIVKGASFKTTKLREAAINFRRTVGYKDETVGFRLARWFM